MPDRSEIRRKVFDEVQAERDRQEDEAHGPWDALTEIHKHVTMAEVAATRLVEQPPAEERARVIAFYRARMVKIAAIACAALEAIDARGQAASSSSSSSSARPRQQPRQQPRDRKPWSRNARPRNGRR